MLDAVETQSSNQTCIMAGSRRLAALQLSLARFPGITLDKITGVSREDAANQPGCFIGADGKVAFNKASNSGTGNSGKDSGSTGNSGGTGSPSPSPSPPCRQKVTNCEDMKVEFCEKKYDTQSGQPGTPVKQRACKVATDRDGKKTCSSDTSGKMKFTACASGKRRQLGGARRRLLMNGGGSGGGTTDTSGNSGASPSKSEE